MSKGYGDAGTPCPTGWKRGSKSPFSCRSRNISDLDDELGLYEDNTAAIDFTTDFRAPLTKAKPRKGGRAKTFGIHEDGPDKLGPGQDKRIEQGQRARVKPISKNSSILSQPAQRFQRPRVSFAVMGSPAADEPAVQLQSPRQAQQSPVVNKYIAKAENKQPQATTDPLKKAIRRRTIYIPPEDTTVPSVFMGIFSPVKSLNHSEEKDTGTGDPKIRSLESSITRKRPARKSFAVAPRRAPLQPSLKSMQEPSIKQDIPGQNGGKENIPPGEAISPDAKFGKPKGANFPVFDVPHLEKRMSARAADTVKKSTPIVKPILRTKPETRGNPPSTNRKILSNKPNVAVNSKPNEREKSASKPKVVVKARQRQGSTSPLSPPVLKPPMINKPPVTKRYPTKLMAPHVPSLKLDQKFPLLSEDIPNPALYEENWLTHQETAITQLVNGLFDSARGDPILYDGDTLRHELLGIYQRPCFSLLFKRVHASLLYGALGVPKDVLARGNGLKEDIGRKRSFLNFWMETYDPSALRAAAETVIGRRIPVPNRPVRPDYSTTSCATREGKQFRRTLESFLETFILRNEDVGTSSASLDGEDVGTPHWSYRRTLLRSIMMIVLLDRARSTLGTILPRCLFNPSSKYKSSAEVLQGLGIMLLPSVGDITRPLSHLDCQVVYKQHPLQEHDYHINNLAVDLRDGILLTRLVELLLYPSASALLAQPHDPDATATLSMPTGEVLSLLEGEEDWVLSQHLRLPCIGRATKLFNVQIALSALSGVQGIGIIAKDIRAEDIVDGYREKTIALLWGLVGKWGLSGLVDWDDVRHEIRRLEKKLATQQVNRNDREFGDVDEEEEEDDFDAGYGKHSFLLKKWATCLARLRGIRLVNLTSSFADGRIFESIVDEYEGFIIGVERSLSCSATLDQRLRSLGCSSQFASLVAPAASSLASASSYHFFDRDFTLAALAFLCSRLLPASKKARAAVVLQSAWKRTYVRRQLQRRDLAAKIATACMTVVQERDKLIWAKGVIIRWWRAVRCNTEKKRLAKATGSVKKYPAKKLPTITRPRNKAASRMQSAKVAFAEDVGRDDSQQGRLEKGDLRPIESDLWLDL
ncbi:hypothetical protein AJ78_01087 [Emergomyces pasteurianus Ep9510]|uniref:Calponin-homology (CH) domain-containing protein n=1 Tax=Emergomyces pasteurianus Ep9510 TaxID=1447872 RepID=A0A1J9QRU4_9EURO|nr:hypothetical protein AJ78_01087 [Emergomyces pasteurianus Ep9510]